MIMAEEKKKVKDEVIEVWKRIDELAAEVLGYHVGKTLMEQNKVEQSSQATEDS